MLSVSFDTGISTLAPYCIEPVQCVWTEASIDKLDPSAEAHGAAGDGSGLKVDLMRDLPVKAQLLCSSLSRLVRPVFPRTSREHQRRNIAQGPRPG
jgi:hypothetical protein